MTNFARIGMVAIGFASFAQASNAGGWDAGTLDTSFMYNEGGYVELSTAPITSNIKANIQGQTAKHKMAKDQTRSSFAVKMEYGDFDFGLVSYMSGAIQLDGQSAHAAGCNPATAAIALCSVVPSADVKMNSLAVLGRYKFSDTFSVIAGANRYSLDSGASVTTLTGYYEVSGEQIVPTYGAAYEMSDIALRVELIAQPQTNISNFAAKSSLASSIATTAVSGESMKIPQTMTLNFQSGIAEDTLLFGSVRQASWKNAQIDIPVNGSVAEVKSDFANRTAYSFGLGRKFTDEFSGSISYATEAGGGSTTNDAFTLRNGHQTLNIGGRYTVDNMTISAGLSYTMTGDVDLTHLKDDGTASGLTASYKDNTVTAFGLKVGFSF